MYAYGPNPLAWVDPLGWHQVTIHANPDEEGTRPGTSPEIRKLLRDEVRNKTTSFANGETDNGKGGRLKNKDINVKVTSTGSGTCSERNVLSKLEGHDLSGRHLSMTGTYPPCSACHQAMDADARSKGGAGITYRWGDRPEDVATSAGSGGKPPPLPLTTPENATYKIDGNRNYAGQKKE